MGLIVKPPDGGAEHRVGFVIDGDPNTPYVGAMLSVSDDEILLSMPLAQGVFSDYEKWFEDQPPGVIHFVSSEGTVSLSQLQIRSRKDRDPGIGTGVLSVGVLVESGPREPGYETIEGLRTEIVGLGKWMPPQTFQSDFQSDSEGRLQAISYRVTRQPTVPVASIRGLSLTPHFTAWADNEVDGLWHMFESTQVETRFPDPTDWHDHLRYHLSIQDLVCLAFGAACRLEVVTALRSDDPEMTLDGTVHEGAVWREATVPRVGRGAISKPESIEGLKNRMPLFRFSDIGDKGLELWLKERDDLGKAFKVLAASFFRRGGTFEDRLLQIGASLEGLAHYIDTRARGVPISSKSVMSYPSGLINIVNDTDADLDLILDGRTAQQWAVGFNQAYKGVKHADNPWPDVKDSFNFAREGSALARLWLARFLGVDRQAVDRLALFLR